jgi:hypothetical protein
VATKYVTTQVFSETDENGRDTHYFKVGVPYTGPHVQKYLDWLPHPLIGPAPSAGSNNPGNKKDEESA